MNARRVLPLVVLSVSLLAACDKAPTINDVKNAVNNTVESVKQTAGAAGSMEIKFEAETGGPLKANGCHVRLYPQTAGRSHIVQIVSYADLSAESYPRFFLRCETDKKTAAELTGQQLLGELFVQEGADGPLWTSASSSPAQLAVTSVEGEMLQGTLKAVLINVETEDERSVEGSLSGGIKLGE